MNKKIGVLLINLGSPAEPTESAVREFLAELLSDPYVVDYQRFLWKTILNGIILKTRPRKSAKLYKSIWVKDGSPIITITKSIAALISEQKPSWIVSVGMRYGEPSIHDALIKLKNSGVEHLVVLPLFPQYSLTTSKTIIKYVNRLKDSGIYFDHVTTISDYHQNTFYIHALVSTIKADWGVNGKPNKLVFSFHGVPQRYISKKMSPYQTQCQTTADMTANNLGLSKSEYIVSYQSRFGPEKWLSPNTKEILNELGKKKIDKLSIICPGFAADCLETLEEIAIKGKENYYCSGGKNYTYIPALNDQEIHIQTLIKIIGGYL